MASVYSISIIPGIQYACLSELDESFEPGDKVTVQCESYQDYGTVRDLLAEEIEKGEAEKRFVERSKGRKVQGNGLPSVLHRTNESERDQAKKREATAKSVFKTAQRKVREHGLNMKMLNSHLSLDGRVALFQFCSEGRVDFRHLLRDLSGALHMRVELRQVGVRDEASIQGGLGPCGRPFCCSTFLSHFDSISVRMAKNQGLSLNPTNISGACGRLKCCLRYEDKFYAEMRKLMPRVGSRCKTPDGAGKVVDRNALTGIVRVALEDTRDAPREYALADCEILRGTPNASSKRPPKNTDKNRSERSNPDSKDDKKNDGDDSKH